MTADPKIIDIISQKKEGPYVSLEYFPPRSAEGVKVRHTSSEVSVIVWQNVYWPSQQKVTVNKQRNYKTLPREELDFSVWFPVNSSSLVMYRPWRAISCLV
jgi:hypothetical protein